MKKFGRAVVFIRYLSVIPGRFLARPNRFIARVETDRGEETVHVKNTGRCRELLVPGAQVYLEQSDNPARKTRCSLVAVRKGELLVNIDSQAPNRVVEEALGAGWRPPGLDAGDTTVRREARWGGSRLDFALEDATGIQALLEVKGVTLEEEGGVFFPDAPTLRGVRHLEELIAARRQGLVCCVLFVVQLEGARYLSPNNRTHPAFGEALRRAVADGVLVRAYGCRVAPDALVLDTGREIPLRL